MTATMGGDMNGDQQGRDWASQIRPLLAENPDGMTRDALMRACDPPIPDVNTFHFVKGILQDRLGTAQITIVGDSSSSLRGDGPTASRGIRSTPPPAATRSTSCGTCSAGSVGATSWRRRCQRDQRSHGHRACGQTGLRMQNRRTMEDIADALTELGVVPPAIPA